MIDLQIRLRRILDRKLVGSAAAGPAFHRGLWPQWKATRSAGGRLLSRLQSKYFFVESQPKIKT
jgi:hypothetical protein